MMHWIETYGGNLICMEKCLLQNWKGNEASSIGGDETDYDRAGNASTYTNVIPVAGGNALVISSGPLQASVWRDPSGHFNIVTVEYSEPDTDEDALLQLVPRTFFDDAFATEFEISTRNLVLFDSVDAGYEVLHAEITFSIDPGTYKVCSKVFSPTKDASFVLHRFQQSWCR